MLRIWLLVLAGLAASVEDLFCRRISNWISGPVFLAGMGVQIHEGGWRGVQSGLAGAFVGGAIFLIFYLLGGMGAGDIKLMAAFGAFLGAPAILRASLWIACSGGILAAGVVLWDALLRVLPEFLRYPAPRKAPRVIPYAPAIAVGVWLSQLAGA